MIPSKDCKELLYNMLNDNVLTMTELSKTSDHAPSRTFYLFTIDFYHVVKKLQGYCYKVSFRK
jgi:DNA-directed RNA polymerase III subunit RPC3